MKRLLTALLAVLLGTGGCADIEYGIVLDRELSGEATLDVRLDLEKAAYVMAKVQKTFAGDQSEPTEEELAQARQQLQEEMDEEEFNADEVRAEIEPELPEGVRLADITYEEDGLRRRFVLSLTFDQLEDLASVNLQPEGSDVGDAPQAEPFGSLRVVDEGTTYLITNAPVNPLEVPEEASQAMPALGDLLKTAFEGLRVAFSIRAPFEVVEHNATRTEGDTLYWEFDIATLGQGLSSDPIRVRYRK